MKTFGELTEVQQSEAIEFAKKTMQESIQLGILSNSEFLTEAEVSDLAIAAAEGGQYSDDGKPTVEKVEVPFYYLGGCV